eukprot:Filipodium_phascolosomae@DN3619_c0_g1_i1.p1
MNYLSQISYQSFDEEIEFTPQIPPTQQLSDYSISERVSLHGAKVDNVSEQVEKVFSHISRYKPHIVDLDTEFMPFVPDCVPTIGEVDAFLKFPPPQILTEVAWADVLHEGPPEDTLGLIVLDEPALVESEKPIVQLHLGAASTNRKPTSLGESLADIKTVGIHDEIGREVAEWVTVVQAVHQDDRSERLEYSIPMPTIESLMKKTSAAVIPFKRTMNSLPQLCSPFSVLNFDEYVQLVCLIVDIPCGQSAVARLKSGGTDDSSWLVDSLHVLFSLYSMLRQSLNL